MAVVRKRLAVPHYLTGLGDGRAQSHGGGGGGGTERQQHTAVQSKTEADLQGEEGKDDDDAYISYLRRAVRDRTRKGGGTPITTGRGASGVRTTTTTPTLGSRRGGHQVLSTALCRCPVTAAASSSSRSSGIVRAVADRRLRVARGRDLVVGPVFAHSGRFAHRRIRRESASSS